MDGQQNLKAIMGLTMYGGNAKGDTMEAIAVAKSGDLELVDKKIADTEESLVYTHHSRMEMLIEEAEGNNTQVILSIVHSQDHLMTAITFTDLVKEITDLYHRIDNE